MHVDWLLQLIFNCLKGSSHVTKPLSEAPQNCLPPTRAKEAAPLVAKCLCRILQCNEGTVEKKGKEKGTSLAQLPPLGGRRWRNC